LFWGGAHLSFGGPETGGGDFVRHRASCVLLLALVPFAALADEQSPLQMSFIETPDLRLIYFDPLGYLVPYAARTFTNALAWQRKTFDWRPSERTTVVLNDYADFGNARTLPAPHDAVIFDVAPVSRAFETYPASERMYSFMNHEMVHIATEEGANATDDRWRRFFLGKMLPSPQHPETLLYSYLTVPRFNAPRWYLEGAAVFMETWMDGGLGRAQGGYDEMVFRAMVRDDAHFYDPLGLVSRGVQVDFQIGANAYLWGTRFLTWLAYRYSPEKVIAWLKRDEGSERYYEDNFVRVFGLPLDQAWHDWIAFERDFQRRNLDAVRKYPLTPVHKLGAGAVGSISRMYYDEKSETIYAAFRYPGFAEHVGALSTRDGTETRLAEIKGAKLYKVASFAYDPASGTAFFTNDNTAYRDLMAVDVQTGEERLLLKDARIGEIAFNPVDRSLMGVRHVYGQTQFVRIPYPYASWQAVYTFPYGFLPYDLDISPDGRLLSASMTEPNADEYLRVWQLDKLLAGDITPVSQFRFGQATPESFVFSPDGRYLYGSSYYTGVSNIFRYEVATGAVEVVSNAETGFFRPMPLADGRLLVLTYTSAGFVPAIIEPRPLKDVSAIRFLGAELAAKHPVVTTWQVPPPSTVDEKKLITRSGDYSPPANIGIVNGYPVLQGYKAYAGVGYRLNFEDPIRFAKASITAAYTPSTSLSKDERAHIEGKFSYLGWRAGLSWNRSDFYDLFGPTIRSRRGFAVNLGYDDLIVYDEPRKLTLKTDIAFYNNLDALPESQNVGAVFPRLLTGQVGLFYTDVRRSLGAVDDEKGWTGSVVLSANQAGGKSHPQLRGDWDVGLATPMPHSSIWLRNAVGVADGDRADPYANFYFGGFGNNYVDSLGVKRYREYYAFPGFGINELNGRSFVRSMLEWNLPPVVFESVGTPAFHLTWLRPAAFASALWTEAADPSLRSRFSSIGAQVDLRFTVLHWYDMALSAGYAVCYRGNRRGGDEWMVSLKIM
jgi:hypothetical protein